MANMYAIAPQMMLTDKGTSKSNPHLSTKDPGRVVVRENVEWQGRYGLQDYDVVRVCLSFQLSDYP